MWCAGVWSSPQLVETWVGMRHAGPHVCDYTRPLQVRRAEFAVSYRSVGTLARHPRLRHPVELVVGCPVVRAILWPILCALALEFLLALIHFAQRPAQSIPPVHRYRRALLQRLGDVLQLPDGIVADANVELLSCHLLPSVVDLL